MNTKHQKEPKQYTIRISRFRMGMGDFHKEVTGTLDYLIDYFHLALESGKRWEDPSGRNKVNMEPKTARQLVSSLNHAAANTTKDHHRRYYKLIPNPEEIEKKKSTKFKKEDVRTESEDKYVDEAVKEISELSGQN